MLTCLGLPQGLDLFRGIILEPHGQLGPVLPAGQVGSGIVFSGLLKDLEAVVVLSVDAVAIRDVLGGAVESAEWGRGGGSRDCGATEERKGSFYSPR